jgi:ribose transport system substrate-binding protein
MKSNTRSRVVVLLVIVSAVGAAILVAVTTSASARTAGRPLSTQAKPFNSLSFVYASAGDSIGIFKTVGDGVVNDAKVLKMKMKRYDNNLDGPTALRNAGLMVQDHPDVAIDWNTVVGVGASVGAQFTRNNVKCLAVNQQIPGCAWFNLSNKQFGLDAAKVILPVAKKRGWNGKNTTVVMVIAAANGTEVNNGPRYFYVTTANTLPNFKKVKPGQITAETTTIGGTNGIQIDCKSTIQGAYEAAKNIVSSIPKSNNILLYGSDTDCDLGAYRALVQGGYGKRILTGGLGGTPEGLKALRTDPNYLVEGALFLQNWAPYILSEAVAIANGVKPPPLTSAPQIMLTKKTVNVYYKGDNVKILPPLVANNKYLAKYGILQRFGKVKGLNVK